MVQKLYIHKVGVPEGRKIVRPDSWADLMARASRDLLDGDVIGSTPLSVKVMPSAFRLLTPVEPNPS